MGSNARSRRIRWHCRRGMLELDMLLHAFFDDEFAMLTPQEQGDFVHLLEQDDQTLWRWVVDLAQPQEQRLVMMVDRIKQHWLCRKSTN